jgi:hypothetical protein
MKTKENKVKKEKHWRRRRRSKEQAGRPREEKSQTYRIHPKSYQ